MDKKNNNKYDKLLIVLILCLSIGLLKGLFLLPIYYFTALSIPLIIQELGNPKDRIIRPILLASVLMMIYGIMTLAWTPDVSKGIIAILIIGRSLALLIDVIILAGRANNPLRSLINGWTYVFILTVIIAIWEITTGQHLSVAREVLDETFLQGEDFVRHTASVTFYNPNTYCVFLVMAFPFLLYKTSFVENVKGKILQVVLLLLLVFVMFMNASRGGLISITIMFLVFLYYNMQSYSDEGPRRTYIVFIILSLLLLFFLFYDTLLAGISSRLENRGMLQDNSRRVLWTSSWSAIVNSWGLGQGVGSMLTIMKESNINSTDILYTHNLLLELLLEEGILYFGCFVYFLYKLYRFARASGEIMIKVLAYSTLIAFPFYSIINSQYTPLLFVWCFYASIYAITYYHFDKETDADWDVTEDERENSVSV